MGDYNRRENFGSQGSYNNNRNSGGRSSDREMFKATCANCGRDCEIPFRPSTGRPVYCHDCFAKNSPQDIGRSRFSPRGRNDSRGEREMYSAICDNCGNSCKVPFQPTPGKSILCSKCFEVKGGDFKRTSNSSSISLAEVNAKLDRILDLLTQATTSEKAKMPNKEKVKASINMEEIPKIKTSQTIEEKVIEEAKELKKPKAKKKSTKKASS